MSLTSANITLSKQPGYKLPKISPALIQLLSPIKHPRNQSRIKRNLLGMSKNTEVIHDPTCLALQMRQISLSNNPTTILLMHILHLLPTCPSL